MKKNEPPIVIEEMFNRSIDDVWDAITRVDQMRKWFFENITSFKPEVGFKTQFNVENEGRNFLHLWEVLKVLPGQKISYNWKYEDYAGDSYVEFELFEQNNGTKLRLIHHVLESFPDHIPEFTRESGIAGWTYFIKESLKEYLEKRK